MKLGFVIKIIKSVFKIGKIVKTRRGTTMPDGNTTSGATSSNRIAASTPVVFTLGKFFAFIGSILTLFVSFYFAVMVPSMNKTTETQKELYDKLYEEQKAVIITQFNEVKSSINANTQAIGVNTRALNATTARFNDLNTAVNRLNNSGGSFGHDTPTTGGFGTDPTGDGGD